MKRIIIFSLLTALLVTAPTTMAVAQKQTQQAQTASTANPTTTPAPDNGEEEEGVVAYSDTTTTEAQDDSVTYYNGPASSSVTLSLDDNPSSLVERWALGILGGTAGFWASAFALLVVILVFLFLCSPFIVLGLFVWYLVRRNRQRLEFAQKAMESGQPIPQEMLSPDKQTDSYMWRKGVKNAFLGLGLVVFALAIDLEVLAAVGGLLICMGAGQCVIAKTSSKTNEKGHDERPDEGSPETADGQPTAQDRLSALRKIEFNAQGQRGLMLGFIGLGIIVFALFIDTEALAGIGGLLICLGVGMCVVAKTSEKNSKKD